MPEATTTLDDLLAATHLMPDRMPTGLWTREQAVALVLAAKALHAFNTECFVTSEQSPECPGCVAAAALRAAGIEVAR